jgi:hypothetical protein
VQAVGVSIAWVLASGLCALSLALYALYRSGYPFPSPHVVIAPLYVLFGFVLLSLGTAAIGWRLSTQRLRVPNLSAA